MSTEEDGGRRSHESQQRQAAAAETAAPTSEGRVEEASPRRPPDDGNRGNGHLGRRLPPSLGLSSRSSFCRRIAFCTATRSRYFISSRVRTTASSSLPGSMRRLESQNSQTTST